MAVLAGQNEISWRIEVRGTEHINNYMFVEISGRYVKVHGVASLRYELTADIKLKLFQGKWVYANGTMIKALVSRPTIQYTPQNAHNIKRYYITGSNTINAYRGKQLGGILVKPNSVKLIWPMPHAFKEPAVEVVSLKDGKELSACFESRHFMDQLSVYHIELQDGWEKNFDKHFRGSTEWALVKYHIRVKKI
jgi:hypothetical protein